MTQNVRIKTLVDDDQSLVPDHQIFRGGGEWVGLANDAFPFRLQWIDNDNAMSDRYEEEATIRRNRADLPTDHSNGIRAQGRRSAKKGEEYCGCHLILRRGSADPPIALIRRSGISPNPGYGPRQEEHQAEENERKPSQATTTP